MLKIHKPHFKYKLLTIPITSILSIGALLGLTYHPNLAHAETVTNKKTIDDIIYMQEMTPEICKNMELEKQYQLTDIRKNFNGTQPTYWVAKLKDGNCWMTQNLDLDIPAEGLSAKDTDILENWNNITNPTYPPEATQTSSSPSFGTTYNAIKSWDPALGGAPTYCNNGTTFGKCAANNNPTTSINDGYDAQGNYYTWGAATAGQASSLVDSANEEQSTQSICPKNWTLPTGGANDGQYKVLFDGLTVAQITNNPYYFVYNGFVLNNSLHGNATTGYYWSATAYQQFQAYHFSFFTDVYPSGRDYRYYGYAIRCLARTESIPNNNVEITINDTISLDVASEVMIEKGDTNPSTATLPVSVASNQPYSVSISSANPSLTSTTSTTTIPSVSGNLTSPTNAWGIKLSSNTNYTQITSTPTTFYTATGAEVKTIPFQIGISTSPDLPNGEYSTNITITATQN